MMKDYKSMSQEELEKELAEIIRKNYEKGVVLLDRNYDIYRLQKTEKVENIDEIIVILRAMKYEPDLKKYCKGMTDKEPLIHPIVGQYAWKECAYDDFVTREEFINRTGIFVTPSYFSYIYDEEWKEAKKLGVSVDDFLCDYEDNSGEVMEVPLHGTFKYLISDDYLSCIGDYNYDDGCDACYLSSIDDPNIWEVINCLARSLENEYESKWEAIGEYKKVLNDVMQTLSRIQLENAESTTSMPS